MKAATLRLLVGVTTPLILGGSVRAGFTGISTASKPNVFGLLTVNVYAEFDRPGEDFMRTVGGTMLLGIITNGVVGQAVVSFFHVPGPGPLWLLGAAGLLGRRRRRR